MSIQGIQPKPRSIFGVQWESYAESVESVMDLLAPEKPQFTPDGGGDTWMSLWGKQRKLRAGDWVLKIDERNVDVVEAHIFEERYEVTP